MTVMMAETLIAPDTKGLRPGAQAQGVEYMLHDPDTLMYAKRGEDGYVEWVPDLQDATWMGDYDELEEFAFDNGLSDVYDNDYEWWDIIDPCLEIIGHPIFRDEDRTDAPAQTPLGDLDFSALGVSAEDFETR